MMDSIHSNKLHLTCFDDGFSEISQNI